MFTNRPNKEYKTEDGPIWHSRSVAVVGAVFVKVKGESTPYILITQRSETMEDEPGKWCLPSGYLDWDETIDQATIREIYEETSLDLLGIKNLAKYPMIRIKDNPNTKRQNISIVSAYMAEVKVLPIVKPTSETSKVMWVKNIRSHLEDKVFAFGHYDLLREVFYDI